VVAPVALTFPLELLPLPEDELDAPVDPDAVVSPAPSATPVDGPLAKQASASPSPTAGALENLRRRALATPDGFLSFMPRPVCFTCRPPSMRTVFFAAVAYPMGRNIWLGRPSYRQSSLPSTLRSMNAIICADSRRRGILP
jgi:hypothetical protein